MLAFSSTILSVMVCLYSSRSISQATQPNTIGYSDLTYSGLYKIVNCNANWPARLRPEAKKLQAFLPEVWSANQRLLDDIQNGTNSRHGFEALFKTNSSINTVISLIRGLKHGPSLGPSGEGPIMLCLHNTSEDPDFQTLYNQTCTEGVVAAAISNTLYLGFCPSLFEIVQRNLDFPIPQDCPVTISNVIKESPHTLTHNAYPIFLEQMLQLYMEHGSMKGDPKNQVFDIQDSIDLNATASLSNIANWEIYAASVYASCASWPTFPDDGNAI